ncbi:Cysteine-rich protein 2-binding protein [Desmophyllum pertusum]|uniref:Cysteine-rich protein 2-binding protein n=1 Tax=Desmophyllum pertusum TaxID=174260 RepID=A0A9W9ZJS1_9CNID|nr:Cysteine-rich protein 2-binding protein [Desmophyllum pertusum]
MSEEVIDPGIETEYEAVEEICYCNGSKDRLSKEWYKPSTLVGDVFFDLTCAVCSSDGSDSCTRQNLSWLQAVYLCLYNLFATSRGRKGCPQFFKSGSKEFNKEMGWWALQQNIAPSIKLGEAGSGSTRKRRGAPMVAISNAKTSSYNLTRNSQQSSSSEHTSKSQSDDVISQLLSEEDMRELAESRPATDPFSSLFSTSYDNMDSFFTGEEEKSESDLREETEARPDDTESLSSTVTSDTSSRNPRSDSLQNKAKSKAVKNPTSLAQTSLFPVSEDKENDVLLKIISCPRAAYHDPVMRRFRRKLILRQIKRSKGLKLLDIDKTVSEAVNATLRYQLTGDEVVRVENRSTLSKTDVADDSQAKTLKQKILSGSNTSSFSTTENVLDRFLASPRMLPSSRPRTCSFLTRLIGGASQTLYRPITSPYTSRILKPFIRRDHESRPLKLQLLQEIIARYHRNDPGWKPPPVSSIDYCYVQPHHIPSVNAMCREFFWPGIDLSECLQYPDFSCVVLYKKFVIGFAFMVPDVNYNEAYISFVLVHPEWRRGGIGTYMIYHLIQTCMGKDVTLHVSVTNPAMLMYQKFGFKPEEFILDFYNRYLPQDSPQCRHAFFLRLRR